MNVDNDTYLEWADHRAFSALIRLRAGTSAMRPDDQVMSCDDGAVIRSVPTGQPEGTFHAVSTRDGEARARDGQEFYEINPMGQDPRGAKLFEIRFGDGLWMLVTSDDISVS